MSALTTDHATAATLSTLDDLQLQSMRYVLTRKLSPDLSNVLLRDYRAQLVAIDAELDTRKSAVSQFPDFDGFLASKRTAADMIRGEIEIQPELRRVLLAVARLAYYSGRTDMSASMAAEALNKVQS